MLDPQRRATDPDNIVLHIISHVDKKIDEHEKSMLEWRTRHEEEEHLQMAELRAEIRLSSEASEKRHNTLLQSLDSYMNKMDTKMHESPCPYLKDAIPAQDWSGHSGYHFAVMAWDEKMKEIRWHILKVVLAAATGGVLVWIGTLAWLGFLKGPGG